MAAGMRAAAAAEEEAGVLDAPAPQRAPRPVPVATTPQRIPEAPRRLAPPSTAEAYRRKPGQRPDPAREAAPARPAAAEPRRQAQPRTADAREERAAQHPPARGQRKGRETRARPMNSHVRLIAQPVYGELLRMEPVLRRAIPFLTIIFILILAAHRIAATVDGRAEAQAQAREEITLLASTLAAEISRRATTEEIALDAIFAESLPDGATRNGRRVALIEDDTVTATSPFRRELVGGPVERLLGANQPMTTFGARAGVMEVATADGLELATVHHLAIPGAMVAITQAESAVLAPWRDRLATEATLFMCTAFVLVVVVYAFYAQAARARAADQIYTSTRTRIDTALTRGRCGLFDWDVARGRMFWTQSMFEVLGMQPRDELMGFREVDALVHPEDGGLYDLAEKQLHSGEPVLDRTLRMLHADGHWIWLRFRAELVTDEETGRPHLIGVALDITEQKRLAELSAAADMRLRDAIETVSEAFVLWDAHNRLVMCNTKYQEMHNLPDEAVKPGTPYHVVIEAARQPVISSQLIMQSDGPEDERSYEAELAGGRWLQINERRTKDGGFVSVGTDITTLKMHEERLMESEKRLKQNVVELKDARRTAENQARQLAELAEKYAEEKTRAEDANRAKSEFLANISHELRTPLNAIIGFSEIMKSAMFGNLGSPKYEEYCADIHHSGTYLLGVINDILDMSRIEAGQVDLSVELVDLAELFTEATRIMTPTSAEKNITLASAISEGMRIQVDRRAMKQILLNLMSNAVKFTPNDGCVTVRARLERDYVVIAVEDNGIGIPKRELERLGQPFVQVENQFTKTHQGSGLGLAIARSLTELHRGKMEIQSEVGVGTTVVVRLPREGADAHPRAA